MLANQLGIRLLLWMGNPVPLPPPSAVLQAVLRVEVTSDVDQGCGFQISFSLQRDLPIDYGLLQDGTADPLTRVVIGVVMGADPQVLIDGVITHHEVAPDESSGQPMLTVSGKDLSVLMDLEERTKKYENQPDSLIALQVLSRYAQHGLVPAVSPTTDVPIVLQRIPWQHETDLKFLQRMAKRNGFVFFIEPQAPGVSSAYFGPDQRIGIPLPALSTNMGSANNVSSLRFFQDALGPAQFSGAILEPVTMSTIPLPPLPALRLPPLSRSPISAQRNQVLRDAAKLSPAQGPLAVVAAATDAPEAIRAEGEVDTARYGGVLKARKLVGVRGVGLTYDGNYYVRKVTHKIEPGINYTQAFTLSREGTKALLPVVVP